MCIYNKGKLLGKSLEGGTTRLVPGLARKSRSEDEMRCSGKLLIKEIVGAACVS